MNILIEKSDLGRVGFPSLFMPFGTAPLGSLE